MEKCKGVVWESDGDGGDVGEGRGEFEKQDGGADGKVWEAGEGGLVEG